MGKVICRNCGVTNTRKVVYGLLNEKIIKQIEKGQVLHGGCAIQGMMQPYYCFDCDTRFGLKSSPLFMNAVTSIKYRTQTVINQTQINEKFSLQILNNATVDTLSIHYEYQLRLDSEFIRDQNQRIDISRDTFFRLLEQVGFDYWKESFIGEDIDATMTWEIRINAPTYFRSTIEVIGTNDQPITMKNWRKLMDSLISETKKATARSL